MTWDEIHNWHDQFESEVTANGMRGVAICGSHIQTWERGEVWISLTVGGGDFVQTVLEDRGNLEAQISFDRFQKIVRGEDHLKDDDFLYFDETID